jgi:hypothetical protein
MPVLRYFLFVGTALLTLLFAVDAYFPKLPADNVNTAENVASDLSVIRIHSVQKWPARVEFDTSVSTVTPASARVAEANVPADATAPARMRDAFAQLKPTQVQTPEPQVQTPEPKKPELKLPPKRRVASRTAPKNQSRPPIFLVAQQPRLGFFPNTMW